MLSLTYGSCASFLIYLHGSRKGKDNKSYKAASTKRLTDLAGCQQDPDGFTLDSFKEPQNFTGFPCFVHHLVCRTQQVSDTGSVFMFS